MGEVAEVMASVFAGAFDRAGTLGEESIFCRLLGPPGRQINSAFERFLENNADFEV
jgi:hypothetical protein